MRDTTEEAKDVIAKATERATRVIADAAAEAPNSPGGAKITKSEAEKITEALIGHQKHLEKADMMKLQASLPPQL